MSRIGKQPIPLPSGVQVQIHDGTLEVKGPKGQLRVNLPPFTTAVQEAQTLQVRRTSEEAQAKALHGLARSLVANAVQGVAQPFRKTLEIHGTGYRAQIQGRKLVMQLGYSHPVEVEPPPGISFEVESPTVVHVVGIDKQLVGQVAADVRATRPVEPYQGKGIRYRGEYVKLRAGKAGKVGSKGK
jgi:large subunit ribosomal protein L6